MSFTIKMLNRTMKCPSIAVGAVWPRLLQMVQTDTRVGKGHGKTTPTMTSKVANAQCSATYGEKDIKHSSSTTPRTKVSFKRAVCKWKIKIMCNRIISDIK